MPIEFSGLPSSWATPEASFKTEFIFSGTYNLKYLYADLPKANNINRFTYTNSSLRYAYLNCPMATVLTDIFNLNYGLTTAKLPNVSSAENFNNAFAVCSRLTNLEIGYWAKSNISLSSSSLQYNINSASVTCHMSVYFFIRSSMHAFCDGTYFRNIF